MLTVPRSIKKSSTEDLTQPAFCVMLKCCADQINGYWDLIPGCQGGKLVYTLVNTPYELLEKEKSSLRFKMCLIDPEANGVYNMAVDEIDKNGTFDDIPINERWVEFEIKRRDMKEVYERVPKWREFMNQLG